MPINPYTQGASFEYKPLGLEAFAAPLANMQKEYDTAQEDLAKSGYNISSLAHDRSTANEIVGQFEAKKNALAEDLMKTKNYRDVSRRLIQLNKLSKEHPEIQAIQGNVAAYQEYVKNEKERLKDNRISEGEFKTNVANALKQHELQGGTGYNRETGDYNSLNFKSLSDDLRPEMNKQLLELGKATNSDKTAWAGRLGIDPSSFTRMSGDGTTEYIDYKELNNLLKNSILSDPRYITSINDRKELELDYAKYHSPEKYNEMLSNIVSNDPEGQKLLSEGKADVEQIGRDIILEQHKNDYISKMVDPVAQAISFKKETESFNEENMNQWQAGLYGGGNGDEDENNRLAFLTPYEKKPFSIESLDKQKYDANKSLRSLTIDTDSIADGTMRSVILGEKGSTQREKLEANPSAIHNKQSQMLIAISKSKDVNSLIKESSKRGIKMNKDQASKIFNTFNSDGGVSLDRMRKNIDQGLQYVESYNDAHENIKSQRKMIEGTDDWDKSVLEFEKAEFDPGLNIWKSTLNPFDDESKDKNAYLKKQNLFRKDKYSPEQLKKLNITPQSKSIGSPVEYLTFSQVAKLKGYKNVEDAVKKGYTFENATIGSTDDGLGKGTMKQHFNHLSNKLVDKNNTKLSMSYKVVNDPKLDAEMNRVYGSMNIEDLAGFSPAYESSWKNIPGFDENGNVLPGTNLNISKSNPVQVVIHGNSILKKIPYVLEDGTKKSIVVKDKIGTGKYTDRTLEMLDQITSTGDALSKESNDMIKAKKFDNKFGKSLSDQLFEMTDVDRNSSKTLSSILVDGEELEIRKVNVNGNNIIKIYVPSTKSYVGVNGKDYYTDDVNAAKTFLVRELGL